VKISARLRDEAATLLAMSANASAGYEMGNTDALRFVSEAHEWSYLSDDARILARQALDACEGKFADVDPWYLRDALEKAEAEALLRTGWTPST